MENNSRVGDGLNGCEGYYCPSSRSRENIQTNSSINSYSIKKKQNPLIPGLPLSNDSFTNNVHLATNGNDTSCSYQQQYNGHPSQHPSSLLSTRPRSIRSKTAAGVGGYVSERVRVFSEKIHSQPENSNNNNPLTQSLDFVLSSSSSASSSATSTLQKCSTSREFPGGMYSTPTMFSRGGDSSGLRSSYNEKKSSKISMFTSGNKSHKAKSEIITNSSSSSKKYDKYHYHSSTKQHSLASAASGRTGAVPDNEVGVWKTAPSNSIDSYLYGKKYQFHHQSSSSLDLDLDHLTAATTSTSAATTSAVATGKTDNLSLRKTSDKILFSHEENGGRKLTPFLHREYGSQGSIDIIGKYCDVDDNYDSSGSGVSSYMSSQKQLLYHNNQIQDISYISSKSDNHHHHANPPPPPVTAPPPQSTTTSPQKQPRAKRLTSKLWGDKDLPSLFRKLRSSSKGDINNTKNDTYDTTNTTTTSSTTSDSSSSGNSNHFTITTTANVTKELSSKKSKNNKENSTINSTTTTAATTRNTTTTPSHYSSNGINGTATTPKSTTKIRGHASSFLCASNADSSFSGVYLKIDDQNGEQEQGDEGEDNIDKRDNEDSASSILLFGSKNISSMELVSDSRLSSINNKNSISNNSKRSSNNSSSTNNSNSNTRSNNNETKYGKSLLSDLNDVEYLELKKDRGKKKVSENIGFDKNSVNNTLISGSKRPVKSTSGSGDGIDGSCLSSGGKKSSSSKQYKNTTTTTINGGGSSNDTTNHSSTVSTNTIGSNNIGTITSSNRNKNIVSSSNTNDSCSGNSGSSGSSGSAPVFIHLPAFAHHDTQSMSCILTPEHIKMVLCPRHNTITGATCAAIAYNNNTTNNNTNNSTTNDTTTINTASSGGNCGAGGDGSVIDETTTTTSFINDITTTASSSNSNNDSSSNSSAMKTAAVASNYTVDNTNQQQQQQATTTTAENVVDVDTIMKGDGRENCLLQS